MDSTYIAIRIITIFLSSIFLLSLPTSGTTEDNLTTVKYMPVYFMALLQSSVASFPYIPNLVQAAIWMFYRLAIGYFYPRHTGVYSQDEVRQACCLHFKRNQCVFYDFGRNYLPNRIVRIVTNKPHPGPRVDADYLCHRMIIWTRLGSPLICKYYIFQQPVT